MVKSNKFLSKDNIKKLLIFTILIFVLLIALNHKKIKGYILYGFDDCKGNCSLLSSEQLNIMGVAKIKCSICSKEFESIPNIIICDECSEVTKRCNICGDFKKK